MTQLCQAQQSIAQVEFLVGTWKMGGKEMYEQWENTEGILKGHSYKMVEGEKLTTETLTIKIQEGRIVYEALVPNQNNGQSIHFILNAEVKDQLSFENSNHDFPKKIQYKKIDDNKLLVNVLGKNDQGFSYYLYKQ
ncbi:hypothetical protein GCM10027429_17780 [Marivirga atlantica]